MWKGSGKIMYTVQGRMDSDPILIVLNSIVFIEITIFFKNISK